MKATTVDVLAAPLREAAGPTLEFSLLLHERTMATLRARGLDSHSVDMPQRSPWRLAWRIAIPAAVAATVAVATWMSLQRPAINGPGNGGDSTFAVSMPSGEVDPTLGLGSVMRQALGGAGGGGPADLVDVTGPYASLDKDAQRLAIFVADQLPSFSLPETHP